MPIFVGIDGYPGGWVAVYLENGRHRFHYASTVDDLLDLPYDRAMIDIPIGLPKRGYRDCDVQAKQRVRSSVFLGARWGVWKFENYEQANTEYWSSKDSGISLQLWHIRTKLREINETMTPNKQERLQETHPELVFNRLNGRTALASKKTAEGRSRRIALLRRHGIFRIEEWLGQRHGTGIGRGDLIDACACAIAARDSKDRLPLGSPPRERGIRMEIWY